LHFVRKKSIGLAMHLSRNKQLIKQKIIIVGVMESINQILLV